MEKTAKIYAVTNQKGGVAKTTTAESLGEGLRLRGLKVLFVDLDPQGNLSFFLKAAPGSPTAFEALLEPSRAVAAVQHARADIIPASRLLCSLDTMLANTTGKEYRLIEALEPLRSRYDCIMVDTPPALGALTVNALTAADAVIIPAQADIVSLQGITQVSETLAAVRRYTNPALRVDGILLTRHVPRTVLARDLTAAAGQQAARLHTKVYTTKIRECVAVREAQLRHLSIFDYAPECNAARDYQQLCKEILGG